MILTIIQSILLSIVVLYVTFMLVSHLGTWYYFATYRRKYPLTGYEPPITIIKPTKGVDQRAIDNFRTFCNQNYGNTYEILFCVEEESDPAVPVIRQVIAEYPDQNVRLILTKNHPTTAIRRVRNLVAGLAHASHDVIVFSDSDTYVGPTFLRDSVAPLQDPKVGVAFSAQAIEGSEDWAAALEAASANEYVLRLGPVCMLGLFDGAVGTAFVTRKSTIEQSGGLEQFGRHCADDIPLAGTIYRHGFRIHLLDQPIRVRHPHDEFKQWWIHMHRWRIILRHFWPFKSTVLHILDLALWWSLIYWAIDLARGVAGIGPWLVGLVLAVSISSAIITNIRFSHNKNLWAFLWTIPLYDLLRLPLLIHSSSTNTISWRGGRFRVHPNGTMSLVEQLVPSRKQS